VKHSINSVVMQWCNAPSVGSKCRRRSRNTVCIVSQGIAVFIRRTHKKLQLMAMSPAPADQANNKH